MESKKSTSDLRSNFFYISMTMANMKRSTNIVPEILCTVNPDSLILLCELLGGKRDIRFPTKEELSNYLLCTLFCYYRFCEKKHTDWIKEKLNIRTKRDWDFLIKTSDAWKELVEKESGVTVEWLFENGNPIKND